ncbi:hypothetical protein KR76_00046 [Pimelobacter simplex]|uniref:Uncharacterized protein n=1 Tax=Nocardioides simplex TaxID=2045 RepID=A0A0C5WXW1_NOCSI|nr:hypothetical protein KR76_00046 [Pimelobacter simplex]
MLSGCGGHGGCVLHRVPSGHDGVRAGGCAIGPETARSPRTPRRAGTARLPEASSAK